MRKELQLAQLEMTEKGKRAAIGAGLFGGAGVVALYGVSAVIAELHRRNARWKRASAGSRLVTTEGNPRRF